MREHLGTGLDPIVERRIPILVGWIAVIFTIFFLRLFQLQIVQGENYQARSQNNSIRTVRLEAARGEIKDRNGHSLATTRPAFGLFIMPSELQNSDLTFSALAQLVADEPEQLAERVGAPRGRSRFQAVSLRADLDFAARARVEAHRYALPGVFTRVHPRRFYVEGSLAAHLLGTIGEVSAKELRKREYSDVVSGEQVGKSGLELRLESHLRGRAGGRNLIVDVAGREVELLKEVRSVRGGTVVLTLDRNLQRAAEIAFASTEENQSLGERVSGSLVAMDPRNGDVLAMLSYPSFDPNAFAGGIDQDSWNALRDDPLQPMLERSIGGQYPPGSTYKAMVAAAVLEENLMPPEERVFCPGSYVLGRRTFRCWNRNGHGWVDLKTAMARSCDVYFYQVGLKLGVDRLAYFARAFGLGRRTQIPLAGEKAGLVPTSEWKRRRFSESWQKGETLTIAIGQGYNLVTPLQMAVAYSALVNGGKVPIPRLVLRMESHVGDLLKEPEPQFQASLPIDAAHLERVRDTLVAVVEEPRGTGGRARVPGIRVGGKTGTAQVVRLANDEDLDESEIRRAHRDHAWFVAFAPAEEPEIVVSVIVEHGGHGGSTAAPLAQAVLAEYFAKKEQPIQDAEPLTAAYHRANDDWN